MDKEPEIKMGSDKTKKSIAGKYLTFVLGNEGYGLEILKVKEINGLMDITAVPRTPEFIKGVINLRGLVIPVVNLRLKFGMPEINYSPETCIIVVNVNMDNEPVLMGIIVDTVSEVLDIVDKDIEPPPVFGSNIKTDYILGMGKSKTKVIILLDIDKVLNQDELSLIKQIEK